MSDPSSGENVKPTVRSSILERTRQYQASCKANASAEPKSVTKMPLRDTDACSGQQAERTRQYQASLKANASAEPKSVPKKSSAVAERMRQRFGAKETPDKKPLPKRKLDNIHEQR